MLSFRGILKYAVYLSIGGWMFFLGIMVGRGTSPVTFDTKKFQERLETLVMESGKKDEPEKKLDLHFYDALNKPARLEGKGKNNNPDEIIPMEEVGQAGMSATVSVPVKTSRKTATLGKNGLQKGQFNGKNNGSSGAPSRDDRDNKAVAKINTTGKKLSLVKDDGTSSREKSRKISLKKKTRKKSPEIKLIPDKKGEPAKEVKAAHGSYTIQVAAYKSFTDAVTKMAALGKKGFASHRTLGKKDGVTWYRVRVGSFATRDAAKLYNGKLKQAKIEGLIIKKE